MKILEKSKNSNESNIVNNIMFISKLLYVLSLLFLFVVVFYEELLFYFLGMLVIASALRFVSEFFSKKRVFILVGNAGVCLFSISIIWIFLKTGVVLTTIYY